MTLAEIYGTAEGVGNTFNRGVYITLPDERARAINNTRAFLRSLLDPKKTPKVPKSVRTNAYYCLKHFPSDYDILQVQQKSPNIFGEPDETP